MKLVDVHCHLNDKAFKDDLVETIERAKAAGCESIVVSGTTPEENRHVLKLSKKFPIIKPSLGIYPIDALGPMPDFPRKIIPFNVDEELKFIEEHKDEIVSIGEIGMDFHWVDKESTVNQQTENFIKCINLANKINKSIVIHSRKSEKECLDILEEHAKVPVDLHCFGGKKAQVKRAIELGYYFSIPPNVVRSHSFQTIIKLAPITQLLTETDAPYLAPEREQRNEPAFITHTIKKMAELKEMSEEDVADQIWKNYEKIFHP